MPRLLCYSAAKFWIITMTNLWRNKLLFWDLEKCDISLCDYSDLFKKFLCWENGVLQLLWWNNYESLVNFWIWINWCMIHEFWAFLCMCLCIWPINTIWDVFWVWKDQNWSVWEKGFWNSKFLFWTEEFSLKQRLSEPQVNVPSSFWMQFAWANRKWRVSEQQCCFCQEFAWTKQKRTPSEHA